MVRLKDIAARAGVSVMTVSKVLRDAPDISPATKARVKMLAEEMGYVPDSLAQGLRTRTTRSIGLVISTVTNPILARAIVAIEEQAYELGYEVLLAHSLNDPAREETVIRRLLSRRVDGLIIAPVYRLAPGAPVYQELLASKTPVVIWGHKASFCAQFASVETEDLLGAYAATQHLIALGHRRIAYFSGPSVAPWNQERLDGYERALRENQLEVDERLIFSAGNSIEEGETAALQMLNEGIRPTAIQACNDAVAVGAASVFLKQGMRIPEDISIVGFGNILLCEYFSVPLTTVHQPKFRVGSAAMESMRKLLKREAVDTKRLPTDLLVRKSTAPPPPE
ncbi:MAG TPA: LacI family DNA-binding transcriptional regulator [Candidatus Kapabacteria bacterium]|nr:LacI family DNA-binding transcriptional regulator [Candidatus Kapabacteria bacterium]